MGSIHHYGTFDVDNYGDLLFPKVAEWRLKPCKIENISPSEQQSRFLDSSRSANAPESKPVAIITGGGNIVKFTRTPLQIYSRNSGSAYPGLVIAPVEVARDNAKPYIINAPSIASKKLNFIERFVLAQVLNSADYISFRDRKSAQIASSLTRRTVNLVPDTAFDISRMWPELSRTDPKFSDYAVFHINQRYGGAPEAVAKAIDKFTAGTGLRALLLPIGPCHGDYEYARTVQDLAGDKTQIVDEFRLKVFAEIIANAALYVGSSMHGFITAASFGIPCGLVLTKDPMNKFEGVLEALSMDARVIIQKWSDLDLLITGLARPKESALAEIFNRLDMHWAAISATINSPACRKRSSIKLASPLVGISQHAKQKTQDLRGWAKKVTKVGP